MVPQEVPNNYDAPEFAEIIKECVENRRNLGPVTIARAAEQQGARIKWFTHKDAWAVFDDRRVAISGPTGTESALASGIEADKHMTKGFMAAAGIPVPGGRRVASAEDAIRAQQEIGGAIVIKPARGNKGHGVTVNIAEPEDIRTGFSRAAAVGRVVLVEQYIEGSAEYRAHASAEDCVAIFRRLLPSIIGDGRSTVAELIEAKNDLRRHNPATRTASIPRDEVAEGFLRRRGLTWESVVPEGERVIVRDVNGITSGGDSEECWDTASDSLKETAVGAIAAIPGMDWGGVDILVEDKTSKPYVVEVNTDAAINGSTFPVFGTPRDLGGIQWRRMYARSAPESRQNPRTPSLLESSLPLIFRDSIAAGGSVTLQGMFEEELHRQGFQITRYNQRIWSAEKTPQPRLWFHTVLGQKDLRIATQPLRRPLLLRTMMRTMDMPLPEARRARTVDQLEAFREKVGAEVDVALIPARTSFSPSAATLLSRDGNIDDSLFSRQRTWLAQARPPGQRFSVIATREEALAVIAVEAHTLTGNEALHEISRLAVSAVRAVPHLRWAIVDVVLSAREQTTAVERLAVNPRFSAESKVIAGSMDNVSRFFLRD